MSLRIQKEFKCKISNDCYLIIDVEAVPNTEVNYFDNNTLPTNKISFLAKPIRNMLDLKYEINMWLHSYKAVEITKLKMTGDIFLSYYFLKNAILNGFIFTDIDLSKAKVLSDLNFLFTKFQNFCLNFVYAHNVQRFPSYDDHEFQSKPRIAKDLETSLTKSLSISVVIATKNVDKAHVTNLLNLITRQIRNYDEIIIVDDNLEAIFTLSELELIDNRIKYLDGSHGGIAATRNIGLLSAKSDLVAFIDSDDLISENFLDWQRNVHERFQDISATGFWLQGFGSHDRVFPQYDSIDPLIMTVCLPPAGVLMWKSRDLRILNGFSVLFEKGLEDFEILTRANLFKMKIVVIDEIKYFYQRGHESLSQAWDEATYEHLFNIVRLNQKQLSDDKFVELLKIYDTRRLNQPVDIMFKGIFEPRSIRLNILSNNKIVNFLYKMIPQSIKPFILVLYLNLTRRTRIKRSRKGLIKEI